MASSRAVSSEGTLASLSLLSGGAYFFYAHQSFEGIFIFLQHCSSMWPTNSLTDFQLSVYDMLYSPVNAGTGSKFSNH